MCRKWTRERVLRFVSTCRTSLRTISEGLLWRIAGPSSPEGSPLAKLAIAKLESQFHGAIEGDGRAADGQGSLRKDSIGSLRPNCVLAQSSQRRQGIRRDRRRIAPATVRRCRHQITSEPPSLGRRRCRSSRVCRGLSVRPRAGFVSDIVGIKADIGRNRGSTRTMPTLPCPEQAEASPMPGDDGLRLDR
jgi:hypothetical protein